MVDQLEGCQEPESISAVRPLGEVDQAVEDFRSGRLREQAVQVAACDRIVLVLVVESLEQELGLVSWGR